jgi:hypothetical protein
MTGNRSDFLAAVEAAYQRSFAVQPARASVSFVGVDPIEVLRFADGPLDHYLSLGMSRYPMSDPNETVVAHGTAPRAELMLSATGRPDQLWRQLAVLAAAPAVEGAVYESGNRVDLGKPLCPGSRCTGGLLAAGPIESIVVEDSAPVQVLRVLPITQTELAWARIHGSDQLELLWSAAGTDLADLLRDPVDLS